MDIWDSEIEKKNENKKGKKYKFPDSFILAIGYIHISFHLPYRHTEDIIKATVGKNLSNHPSYGHICKRINRLDIEIKECKAYDDDDYIVIGVETVQVSRL